MECRSQQTNLKMRPFVVLLFIFFSKIPSYAFNLEGDFENGNFLRRLSDIEALEKNFKDQTFHHNPIASETDCEENERDKRSPDSPIKRRKKRATIAWPQRSKFSAELYYTVPLIAPAQITVPVAFGVPFTFDIPNATKPLDAIKRRSIEDRYNIYGTVEGIFQSFGIDGRSCILRAICEQAEHHLLSNGILSELVKLILTVNSASSHDGLMYDYVEADKQGSTEGNCARRYSSCPFSIFKFLGTN